MKILGIESSALVASVAIWEDGVITAEYTVNFKKTHSQTLLPMIDEIFRMTEQDKGSIDAIAIAAGPGSFTGLRIGSATAKGLGLAWNVPLISVPTLDAMAYQCFDTVSTICPIMDARRNQVYNALFEAKDGNLTRLTEDRAIALADLAEELRNDPRPKTVVGDGARLCFDFLQNAEIPCRLAPAHLIMQNAMSVALEAEALAAEGAWTNAQDLQPVYLRPAQAERLRQK